MPPRRLEIAPLASRELNEILDYTEETWGLEQALDYSEALFASFNLLCSFPDIGKRPK